MNVSIDIGGTNTRIASSVDLKGVHKIVKFKTPNSLPELQSLLKENILKVSDQESVQNISLGAPGFLDIHRQQFKFLPNIQWLNGQFAKVLLDGVAYKSLFLQNDAALAGLAEAKAGSGSQYGNVAYLTLSTGVGGCLIENQTIPKTRMNVEPGHHILDMGSSLKDSAGISGSMEALLSGKAFVSIYGVDAIDCADQKIWKDYGKNLAVGLVNILTMWSPDVVVLGGSLSNKFELFIESTNVELEKYVALEKPPVLRSTFMDDAGLIGGFFYVSQKLHS